jgi:hypothetical protein
MLTADPQPGDVFEFTYAHRLYRRRVIRRPDCYSVVYADVHEALHTCTLAEWIEWCRNWRPQ